MYPSITSYIQGLQMVYACQNTPPCKMNVLMPSNTPSVSGKRLGQACSPCIVSFLNPGVCHLEQQPDTWTPNHAAAQSSPVQRFENIRPWVAMGSFSQRGGTEVPSFPPQPEVISFPIRYTHLGLFQLRDTKLIPLWDKMKNDYYYF